MISYNINEYGNNENVRVAIEARAWDNHEFYLNEYCIKIWYYPQNIDIFNQKYFEQTYSFYDKDINVDIEMKYSNYGFIDFLKFTTLRTDSTNSILILTDDNHERTPKWSYKLNDMSDIESWMINPDRQKDNASIQRLRIAYHGPLGLVIGYFIYMFLFCFEAICMIITYNRLRMIINYNRLVLQSRIFKKLLDQSILDVYTITITASLSFAIFLKRLYIETEEIDAGILLVITFYAFLEFTRYMVLFKLLNGKHLLYIHAIICLYL